MLRIAISGAAGKMGGRIINLIAKDSSLKLTATLEQNGHSAIGRDVCGIEISDNPGNIKDADCLIEFATPRASIEHLEAVLKYKKPMVIGTTGLSPEENLKIRKASKVIPIVFSPNMSIGVNIFFKLVKLAAQSLPKDYFASIIEAHHVHKKDAPSGTAKRIAGIIKAEGGEIKNIESIREGEIIGDHRISFEGPFDKIELFHSAKTRDIFAQGALKAAKWVIDKQPGIYNMQDVLKK
ncbi:MAG: 4-hydroxy-tetrahydrodipicolinate reductase [Candidatus Omnitrophota bacterium]|nr:4-hydroxy-tetrahydrodipicolinate reductase [Candidatus Omnitrophota bacterium]